MKLSKLMLALIKSVQTRPKKIIVDLNFIKSWENAKKEIGSEKKAIRALWGKCR